MRAFTPATQDIPGRSGSGKHRRIVVKLRTLAVIALLSAVGVYLEGYEALRGGTGVLQYDQAQAFQGYTLYSPLRGTTTYLIDMEGNIVHQWNTQYAPGLYAYLLDNGNLLRGGQLVGAPVDFGGTGGIVQELDWDGNVVWEHRLLNNNEVQHHDFRRMPNGNTLLLAWERKSRFQAYIKGRKPATIPADGMWPDFIREVAPDGTTVWEWHAWDHVGTGINQLDINFILPAAAGEDLAGADWTHGNSIDYLPETNQIILSSRNFSEFFVIDRLTGNIVYRWGNPCTYGGGSCPSFVDNGDQIIFGQHDVTRLPSGNVLLFDNGWRRPEGERSAAVEMNPATGDIVWQYIAYASNSFNSQIISGAQRLSNGNTLICSGVSGHIFEVTAGDATTPPKVVWDFINPVSAIGASCFLEDKPIGPGAPAPNAVEPNAVFRAYRYAADHPALIGRDLSPKGVFKVGCPEEWTFVEPPGIQTTQATNGRGSKRAR
jgi:hypothetical protein